MALHGFVRSMATLGLRRGDPQARLIADPVVRADPTTFADQMRKQGPVIRGRVVLLTFDHAVAFDLLRSDDFQVSQLGANLPKPLRWIADKTNPGLLHPIEPPSLLSIEPPDHTRMRKLVSSVFTTRAVATLRERVEQTAHELLDGLEAESGVVDIVERYCAQLPVAVIGDILGVPEPDRPNILRYGELGAPSLDIGLSWSQYQQVNEGIIGFETWLNRHLRTLRRDPGRPAEPDHHRVRKRGHR